MNLEYLLPRGAEIQWTVDTEQGFRKERIDVDLRNVKLKDVTVVLEDDGTRAKLTRRIEDLKKSRDSAEELIHRTILNIKIEALEEVLND